MTTELCEMRSVERLGIITCGAGSSAQRVEASQCQVGRAARLAGLYYLRSTDIHGKTVNESLR